MAGEAAVLTDLNRSDPGLDYGEAIESPGDGYADLLANKRLWKKTLADGRGRDSRPQTGDQVTLKFEGRLADGTLVESEDAFSMSVGECEHVRAFDAALLTMELDEQCQLVASPHYAYGSSCSVTSKLGQLIPPNSVMHYTVKLLAVDDPVDYSALPLRERLAIAGKRRERGNDLYNREDYMSAINCYDKAAKILEEFCSSGLSQESAGLAQEVLDSKVRVYNNMAAAQVKICAFDAAVVSCESVLKLQPDNVKALFRKGKSLVNKGELVNGLAVLRSALEKDPDSRLVQNEVAKATLEIRRQQSANHALYKKMLGLRDPPKSGDGSSKSWLRRHGLLIGAAASLAVSLTLAGAAYKYTN